MNNSSNGMITYIWGPALWHSLHTISFNYPIEPTYEQKKDYKKFFFSLSNVLPCKHCRDNYKKNINSSPTQLTDQVFDNRETLSRWLYDLHNRINVNLGKPVHKTYEHVRAKFEQFRAGCSSTSKPTRQEKINPPLEKGCTISTKNKAYKPRCVLTIVPREANIGGFIDLYKNKKLLENNLKQNMLGGTKRHKSKRKRKKPSRSNSSYRYKSKSKSNRNRQQSKKRDN